MTCGDVGIADSNILTVVVLFSGEGVLEHVVKVAW